MFADTQLKMTKMVRKVWVVCALGVLLLSPNSHAEVGALKSASPPAKSSTNIPKKWETDAALREGMENIRRAIAALRTDIDNERLKQEDYRQLAELIGSNMASIVKNCRLPQNADKAFHNIVLADINWGRETMLTATNVKAQRAGTLAVIQALRNYGEHFDHPGWTVDGPR